MLKVIELFGGIGACAKALENSNIAHEVVDMVEINKISVKAYNIIHNSNFEPQDVTTWNKDIKCDLLWASTPCQAFSYAGKGLGAQDHRGAPLWDATLRIIKQSEPHTIIIENVKGLLQKKHADLLNFFTEEIKKLGYENIAINLLNAKYFGVPQNRERVFIIASKNKDRSNILGNPDPYKSVKLKDILEDEAPWFTCKLKADQQNEKYLYLKNEMKEYNGKIIEVDLNKLLYLKTMEINRVAKLKKPDGKDVAFNQDKTFTDINGISNTLVVSSGPFKNKIMNFENMEIKYRKLTALECLRLMSFEDKDYINLKNNKISDNQIAKLAGNSVVVKVIELILYYII